MTEQMAERKIQMRQWDGEGMMHFTIQKTQNPAYTRATKVLYKCTYNYVEFHTFILRSKRQEHVDS